MNALVNRLRGLIRPSSCPIPGLSCPAAQRRRRLVRLWLPLVMFAVPTVVIAYGFVIPGSCIAGFNGLSFGFATTVLGACLTYAAGIRAALKE
jgi:ABC-type Fe3+ transport system permease subunit